MKKRIKIAVFSAAGVLLIAAGVWFGAGRLQQGEIKVFAVQDLSQSMWEEGTSLTGNITSSVSQQVRLQEKQIVSQVYVQEGQEVKEGDSLLAYDMTLVSLDLEMEKLNKRQLEIKKKGLEQDLAKLEEDKTKLTRASGTYQADILKDSGKTWKLINTAQELPEGIVTEETAGAEPAAQKQETDSSEAQGSEKAVQDSAEKEEGTQNQEAAQPDSGNGGKEDSAAGQSGENPQPENQKESENQKEPVDQKGEGNPSGSGQPQEGTDETQSGTDSGGNSEDSQGNPQGDSEVKDPDNSQNEEQSSETPKESEEETPDTPQEEEPQRYALYLETEENMTVSTQQAQAGEEISVLLHVPEGYEAKGIQVTDLQGETITVKEDSGIYYFQMPQSEVYITPLFEKLPCLIRIESTEFGTIKTNVDEAKAGEEIVVTAEAQENYVLEKITAADQDGNPLEVTRKEDGTYSFLMPETEVVLQAKFIQKLPEPSGVYTRIYGDISLEDPMPPQEGTLVENAVPFAGIGSQEDPLRFLCTKGVLVQGAFLNRIAGYRGGEEKEADALYCRFEVRSEDSQDGVLLAAMVLDGNSIEEKLPDTRWYLTHLGEIQLEEAMTEEEKAELGGEFIPEGELSGEDIPIGDFWEELPGDIGQEVPEEEIISGYTKEELDKAITQKKQEITTAVLDMKEADLKIQKVEKELSQETVKSTVNGVVKKVGDPEKGEIDGEPFIIVESKGGVYVQGLVDEYTLDKLQPGQMVTGMGYESGTFFQAEVREVSPYPSSSYQVSDRELSYYPFTAFIQEGAGLKDNEGVSMDMMQSGEAMSGIFLSKEFVRTSNGEDFVYIEDENHRLKKQPVKTGKIYYGYTVEIKSGITAEDHIAFPYGKKVKDGAKVKRAEVEELYNMY